MLNLVVREEKLTKLVAMKSQEYSPWGRDIIVSQHRINLFASATGDDQWIHTDPERAKKGPFGKTIAQGFLSLALIAEVQKQQTEGIEREWPGTQLLHKEGAYQLKKPVPEGSRIHARGRIIDAVRRGNRMVILIYEYQIALYGGDVVAEGTMELVCIAP